MRVFTAHFWRALGLPWTSLGAKPSEQGVVGRVHGDQLAGDVARELGDDEAVVGGGALELVAIGLRPRRLVDVDEAARPGRDLDALVAEARGPPAHVVEGVERRLVADELGKKDRRAL